MRHPTFEFRELFLIHSLQRLADGSYIALNRRYKPLGMAGGDRIDYEAAPGRFKFKRALSKSQVAALAHDGDTSAERIYLYDDGSVPTDSAAAWAAYAARLRRLAGYQGHSVG